MNLKPLFAGIIALLLPSFVSAQVPLPMCNVNATCPVFTAPAFAGDGSRLTNLPGSGGSPTGPAGGDLTGTYPNPTLKASQGNVTAFTNAAGITVISSVSASAYYGNGANLTGLPSAETNTFTSSKTFTQAVLGLSSITASAFFGDGSHLSGVSSSESNTFTSSKTFTNAVLIGGQLNGSTGTFTNAVTAGNLYSNGDATMFASLTVAGPFFRADANTFNVAPDSVAINSATVDPNATLHIRGAGTEAPVIVTSGVSNDFTGVILGNTSSGSSAATGIDLESDDGSAQIALAGSNNVSPGAASKLVVANGNTLVLISTFNTITTNASITASSVTANKFFGAAYSNNNIISLDFNSRLAYDSTGTRSLNWESRELRGVAGGIVADWDTPLNFNAHGTVTIGTDTDHGSLTISGDGQGGPGLISLIDSINNPFTIRSAITLGSEVEPSFRRYVNGELDQSIVSMVAPNVEQFFFISTNPATGAQANLRWVTGADINSSDSYATLGSYELDANNSAMEFYTLSNGSMGLRFRLDEFGNANVTSSMTVTGIVTASTFNAVGSAYEMNGVVVIDHNRNIFASSVTASAFFGNGSNITGVTATSVPPGGVDLSTVTTALATKASSGTDNTLTRLNALNTIGSVFTELSSATNVSAQGILVVSSVTAGAYFGDGSHLSGVTATSVASGGVDFSTITASLNTKLSSGAIPSGFVDLSTVTTALATKASSGTDNTLTRLNALNTIGSAFTALSSMTNTSANGIQVISSITAGAYFGDGSHITGVTATSVASGGVDFSTITASLNTKLSSGAIPSGFVDLSTVTTALATKASSGTDNTLTRLNALNTIGSAFTVLSSMTNTSTNGVLVNSSVTAGGFYGSGFGLTGVNAASVASGGVDFSTITTSLNTKLSSGAIPSGFVDLSTVTTALATKASSGTDNTLTRLNALTTIGSAFTVLSSMTNTSANGVQVISSVTAGAFFGDGSHLTGVTATSVASGGVDFSTITTALATKASTGTDNTLTRLNALATIGSAFTELSSMTNTSTNGILVNSSVTAGGFYGNGFGLTGVKSVLSGGVDFSTITTSLNTKLSSGAIPSGFVDLSTVTTALAGKLSITGTAVAVASGGVDFSTITTSLNTKLSSGAIPSGFVDLSTVTTALATKASSGTDNTITRLNALVTIGSSFTELSSMTNTSTNGILVNSSVTAGGFYGNGFGLTGVKSVLSGGVDFSTITTSLNTKLSSGAVPSGFIDLSTVTTALATKASSGTDNTLTRLNALNTIGSAFTALSSMTNTSANGILVTYGVNAASGVYTSSVSVTAGGMSVSTSATAAGPAFAVDPSSGNVYIATATFIAGQLNLSTSPTSGFIMQLGKGPTGESYITNATASGAIRFMGGKINPQIILGSAQSTGTGFFDMSSGRPLALQTLSTGVVQIQNLEMQANSSMTVITSLTISGTGAPATGFALCLASTGKLGHCTSVVGIAGGCTCTTP